MHDNIRRDSFLMLGDYFPMTTLIGTDMFYNFLSDKFSHMPI